MPPRIPTLGFPSLSSAARALHDQGLAAHEIARRMGVSQRRVRHILAIVRYERRNAGLRRAIVVPIDTLTRLLPDAERRNIGVPELARRILEIVADNRMVDAVLDDMEGS